MRVIGLTGPTGAGKSTVAAAFAKAGALIVDADRLAREVVEKGHPCLLALASHFGNDILNADGTLCRPALAAKAFACAEETQRLNDITHPFIIARSRDILQSSNAPLAVIDAPLLFESGMDGMCDQTVAVLAPDDTRLARIMERDGIDADKARQRMNAQPHEEFYRERATHILRNEGTLDAFEAAVQAFVSRCFAEVT